MSELFDLLLHLDKLPEYARDYGGWMYVILFLIVFCETGLVVTPFLPGDSLLFAAGAAAGVGAIDPTVTCLLLIVAAILGDTVNYHVGYYFGPKILSGKISRFLNRKHLEKTQAFFEKHGGKTIVIARFLPILRTFAPFVAGVGSMNYGRFLLYNVAGGVAWVVSFVLAGYFFASHPAVKEHFTLVILGIIFVSILPAAWEFARHYFFAAKPEHAPALPEACPDPGRHDEHAAPRVACESRD